MDRRTSRRSWLRALLGVSTALSLGPVLASCGLPGAGELIVYTSASPELARASIDPETGSWQSAPWAADGVTWLPYPGQGRLQLEHGLGRVPTTVLVYLSFDRSGASPGLASGDLAHLIDADATTVTLRNATNGNYFARVVAQ